MTQQLVSKTTQVFVQQNLIKLSPISGTKISSKYNIYIESQNKCVARISLVQHIKISTF